MRLSSIAGTRQAEWLQMQTKCALCPAIAIQTIRIRGENMLVCAKCADWTRELQKVKEAN